MMINMIDLEGNTKQYYNAKKVLDWTLNLGPEKVYDIRLVYDERGNLEGFGWKDEDSGALSVILSLVLSGNYVKIVPKTVKSYRQKKRDTRTVKVTATKNNSYSIYIPTTWAKELQFDINGYVDMQYNGDGIVIRKSLKTDEDASINIDNKELNKRELVENVHREEVIDIGVDDIDDKVSVEPVQGDKNKINIDAEELENEVSIEIIKDDDEDI